MPFAVVENHLTTERGLKCAVTVREIATDLALEPVYDKISNHKGALFSSGFDYPGRHSRWDMGFVNPALELKAFSGRVEIIALNQQGCALLPELETTLKENDHVLNVERQESEAPGNKSHPACNSDNETSQIEKLVVFIKSAPKFFTEEQRSRQPSVFSVLRQVAEHFRLNDKPESLASSHFGLFGAFGYDLVLDFENIERRLERPEGQVDFCLYLPLELVVVDRRKEQAWKLSYSFSTPFGSTSDLVDGGKFFPTPEASGPSEIVCDHQPKEFVNKVQKVIEGTKRGDYFEVVLSQCFSAQFSLPSLDLFKRMGTLNPSPYMFLLNLGEEQLVGTSPEIYTRVNGRRFETCPIAGTIPRGKSALEDAQNVKQLISSTKDESELTMCTDVDRNDMARVCVPGSVRVLGRRQLEFYSHLIHTVDHLEGILADGYDSLDAFQTHMWACTVTGAPKPAALQEIENLEKSPRAWYSSAIGMLLFNGNLNTGITLRTAHIRDGRAQIRAGATLLYGSDPEMEEQETRTKASAFLAALTQLNQPAVTPVADRPVVKMVRKPGKRVLLVFEAFR